MKGHSWPFVNHIHLFPKKSKTKNYQNVLNGMKYRVTFIMFQSMFQNSTFNVILLSITDKIIWQNKMIFFYL